MPVYNAAPYLAEATESILNQTFRDFEFIIVNDGSTDDTAVILAQYANSDARVKVYHQKNEGTIAARNRGCRLARGKYIAVMDADDISLPRRFERQLGYLEKHPEVGILGTWLCTVDDETGVVTDSWCPSTNPKMLKWTNFFGVCVAQGTVLMRRNIIQEIGFYRADALHSEDSDLWLRAAATTVFGNVPEILYKYRIWSGSGSRLHSQIGWESHVRSLMRFIKESTNIEPSPEAVAGLRQTRVGPPFKSLRQIHETAALIEGLYNKFVKDNLLTRYERSEISWDAAKRIASMALQAFRFDPLEAVPLCMQAVKLDHRLLYPSAMIKGLERAFQG
jgi:glycosyltransferase involved in cell wall biosynthesis